MAHLNLTPEERAARSARGRKAALARAEKYRTGELRKCGLPKAELNKRRRRQLIKKGLCERCAEPADGRLVCRSCTEVRNLKNKHIRALRIAAVAFVERLAAERGVTVERLLELEGAAR